MWIYCCLKFLYRQVTTCEGIPVPADQAMIVIIRLFFNVFLRMDAGLRAHRAEAWPYLIGEKDTGFRNTLS